MASKYTLYGWHLSYFTGKALCYLRYKQVPFELKPVNLFTLQYTIKKKTGAVVMPVLKTPTGSWVQDTSVIIDEIEAEFPQRPVLPADPVVAFASLLLEAWGDEWWVPHAMYTRWAHAENYVLFEREAGQALLPGFPRFVQNKVAAKPARFLRGMLPAVGIVPSQTKAMDDWLVWMLNSLEAHFETMPFLMGQRPSLADFSLAGPMYGHLGRDPWPKRELVGTRAHLKAWLDRISNASPYAQGELLAGELPATLAPLFQSVFQEFVPMVAQIAQHTQALAQQRGVHKRLPRTVGNVRTTMAGQPFERAGLGYTLWMFQRAMDYYAALPATGQQAVATWLESQSAQHILTLPRPRVRRMGLTISVDQLSQDQ